MDSNLKQPIAIALAGVIAAAAAAASPFKAYIEPSGVRARPSDVDRGAAWLTKCLSDDAQLFTEARLRRSEENGAKRSRTGPPFSISIQASSLLTLAAPLGLTRCLIC
jgi:hypothetical protein